MQNPVHVNVDHLKGNTDQGFRYQPLTPEALRLLAKIREQNPDGEFILMKDGRQLNANSFNRWLKRYCEECGITPHSSHKIRFCTARTHNDCHDNALSPAGIAGTRHSRCHDFGTLLNILCMYDTDMDLHICVSLYPHNPVYHVPPKPYFVRYIYIHFLTTQKMLQTLILSTFEALL